MNRDTRTNASESSRNLSTTQKFTDERIQELSSETLSRCQDIDSTNIHVSVSNGIVHLDGTVQNEEAFTIAESCLKNIAEIRGIENALSVRSPSDLH